MILSIAMMASSFFNTRKFISRVFLVFLALFLNFCLVQTTFAVTENVATTTKDIVPLEQSSQNIYTEKQLQDIVSPSVVRIIQRVEGTAQVPSFVIDIKNRKISVDKTKKSTSIDNISESIIGTGFIVSPNGYILTNAHFVSDLTAQLAIVTPYIEKAVIEAESLANENIEDDKAFSLEILDFVIKNSTFDLNKEIIVVNPQKGTDDKTSKIFSDISEVGLLANIFYVNNNFYKEGDNLAVIKIEGKDFPSIFITKEDINLTDSNFYTFNAPGVYNFKNINDFKNGSIYNLELKKSPIVIDENNSSLHTSIKFNSQSSGSPFFNLKGEVVGSLAFEGKKSGSSDSSQMLIIPNKTVSAILDKIGIANGEGTYALHAKKGFEYINSGRCEEARSEFGLATSSQSIFTKNTNLDSYLTVCYEAKNLSETSGTKDASGILNTIQVKLTSLDLLDWIIMVLVILLGVSFLIILSVIFGKIKKSKKEQTYESPQGSRSEEVQRARRVPLSGEFLPQTKEVPIRPVGSDVVLSGDKIVFPAKNQDDFLVQKIRLEVKNSDEKIDEPQNVKIAETQSYESHLRNETTPSLPESLRMIPKEDQEELAELWPNKFSPAKILVEVEVKLNVNPELVKYIHETREFGFNDEKIKQELTKAGWGQEDIENAFAGIKK